MGGNQMLPAHRAVLPPHCLEEARVVHARCRVVVAMHRDAVEPADCIRQPGVARTLPDAARQLQHRAVEGEVGVEGCGTAQGFHALRNPAERTAGWRIGRRALLRVRRARLRIRRRWSCRLAILIWPLFLTLLGSLLIAGWVW